MGKTFSTGLLTNGIWQDSSNNIGIGGAANASYKLAVTGASLFTGALTATGQVEGTIINSTSNAFRLSGNNALSLVTLNSQSVVKINAAGFWGTQLVGANDQGILITNTGYVGIGTSNPSSRLTIIRDSPFNTGDQGLRIRATDGDGYNLWMGASSNGYATIQSYQDNVGGRPLLLNPLNGGNVIIGSSNTANGHKLEVIAGSQSALRIDVTSGFSGISMSPGAIFGIDKPGIGGGTFQITSGGCVAINNPSDKSEPLSIQGFLGNWTAFFQANTSTSNSYGPLIYGGTNTSDWALYVASGAGTPYFRVRGDGSTFVAGSLSKGSGSFRIDHPLESMSDTHELVHSFIEGPQADLIYRGKLTLVNGKAQANIDEVSTMTEGTFEALCREVQCFTTNESGWDAVRGKVIGNIIYIESNNPNSNDEISWMVIGERKDKHMLDTGWTDKNGKVIVEPLKTNEPDILPK